MVTPTAVRTPKITHTYNFAWCLSKDQALGFLQSSQLRFKSQIFTTPLSSFEFQIIAECQENKLLFNILNEPYNAKYHFRLNFTGLWSGQLKSIYSDSVHPSQPFLFWTPHKFLPWDCLDVFIDVEMIHDLVQNAQELNVSVGSCDAIVRRNVSDLHMDQTGKSCNKNSICRSAAHKPKKLEKIYEAKVDGDLYDFTFVCDGKELQAHKFIVTAVSDYVKRIVNATNLDRLVVHDIPFGALKAIIDWVYTGTFNWAYDVLEVCAGAEKLAIDQLFQCCKSYILNSLTTSNVIARIQLTNVLADQLFKQKLLNFVRENWQAITTHENWNTFCKEYPEVVAGLMMTLKDI